jgi:hypothetical protein
MAPAQQIVLLEIVSTYLGILPDGPLQARMRQIKEHLSETYFVWIGGFGDYNPYYFRIHSPVIFLEFDHQPGVFLANPGPAKHHVHTLIRTPNGNDYGHALLRQYVAGE